jgi:hypothetical protein
MIAFLAAGGGAWWGAQSGFRANPLQNIGLAAFFQVVLALSVLWNRIFLLIAYQSAPETDRPILFLFWITVLIQAISFLLLLVVMLEAWRGHTRAEAVPGRLIQVAALLTAILLIADAANHLGLRADRAVQALVFSAVPAILLAYYAWTEARRSRVVS